MDINKSNFHKYFLYLALVLKFPIQQDDHLLGRILKFYEMDVNICRKCFLNTKLECKKYAESIIYEENLRDMVVNLFGNRQILYGRQQNGKKIVIKYLASNLKNDLLYKISDSLSKIIKYENVLLNTSLSNTHIDYLKTIFFNENQLGGLTFCPAQNIDLLVDILKPNFQHILETWLYMIIDIQAIILPVLQYYKFPVPRIYNICGFVLFESYDGLPLTFYYNHPIDIRLHIAKLLLEAAFKFTNGFKGYKIYLTDANPDNIVFNEESRQISIVDMDNIIIVDSNCIQFNNDKKRQIHNYEMIECKGCFSFIPADVCSHFESDLNYFTICQLLREDLYGDIDNGLLHSIHDSESVYYQNMRYALDECFLHKNKSIKRAESAENLIIAIDHILLN